MAGETLPYDGVVERLRSGWMDNRSGYCRSGVKTTSILALSSAASRQNGRAPALHGIGQDAKRHSLGLPSRRAQLAAADRSYSCETSIKRTR